MFYQQFFLIKLHYNLSLIGYNTSLYTHDKNKAKIQTVAFIINYKVLNVNKRWINYISMTDLKGVTLH